jgi:hypothetical protein
MADAAIRLWSNPVGGGAASTCHPRFTHAMSLDLTHNRRGARTDLFGRHASYQLAKQFCHCRRLLMKILALVTMYS